MLHIESYRRIVGDYPIAEIYKKARKLYGKNILDINSTYMGGGVAEILSSMVPLINNVGIDEDELGKNGKEHVRKNFLITRLIIQHLDLLNEVLS